MPGRALATIDASVALRTSSGSRSQIVAVQLDEIEGVEERAIIMAAVANEIERGNAIVIKGDRRGNVLTINGRRRARSLPGRL